MKKIGIIGVGNMGAALARGFINSEMIESSDLILFDIDTTKLNALGQEIDFKAAQSLNDPGLYTVDRLIIAVKPQVIDETLRNMASMILPSTIVVSIAAGIPIKRILNCLNKDAKVIRVMPNAGAMCGQGAAALSRGGATSAEELQEVARLFSAVGKAVIVEEKLMDIVTALSGGGPAYLFAIMEAMTDAAVLLGMDRPTARELTVQTLKSAAAMAENRGASFSDLKDMITSPGGTTIAGMRALEKAGVRGTMMDVISAAANRSKELGA